MAVGNAEEAYIEDKFANGINIIFSNENNKGKTIVIGTHGTALSTILHHYNNDFGVKDFLRIVNWMPYIVELRFNNNEFVELIELAHVDKG